jgi:hypothetical protein
MDTNKPAWETENLPEAHAALDTSKWHPTAIHGTAKYLAD